MTTSRVEFLVMAAAMDSIPCEIFTLESGSALIAALVCFRDGGVRRFYTIYYEHSWRDFSPGVALVLETTRRSLAEHLDCDYMTGEQPHKIRLAGSRESLFGVEASAEVLRRVAQPAMSVQIAA